MPSSTIFLDEHFLHGQTGDGIILADSGVIGTSQVGSNIQNTMLSLSNYDKTSPNILLNPQFNTGTLSSWGTVGSPTIQSSDYPGLLYQCSIDNLESIFQTVASSFQYKHPVFEFWHKGESLILSLETRDGSNVYVDGVNRFIPRSDTWVNYSVGMRNYYPVTAISAKITLSSVWDGAIVTNCSLIASDYFSSVNIGDEFDADNTDVVRISGKKLMIGSGLAGINNSILDIRGNSSISGDLFVNGTIYSNIIFGPPGTLSFATSLIFSSGSSTVLNWTSGLIQTVDSVSYGINSGSTIISGLTYIYLDLTISSSILQTSTTFSDSIGNQRIFLGTAQNQSVGNVSFTSQSGQSPIISGQQLTPASVTFDKVFINTLSAITASMGALSVDNLLTMSGVSSAITIGTTPPTSSVLGSGIWLDRTGIYSLNSDVQQATLSNLGLSAANGQFLADVNGITLNIPASYSNTSSLTFKKSGVVEASLYAYDDGINPYAGFKIDTSSSTGSNKNYPSNIDFRSKSKTGYSANVFMVSESDGSSSAGISVQALFGSQSIIGLNYLTNEKSFVFIQRTVVHNNIIDLMLRPLQTTKMEGRRNK